MSIAKRSIVLLSALAVSAALVSVSVLIRHFYRPIPVEPPILSNLIDGWEMCAPANRLVSECNWIKINLPTKPYPDQLKFTHWIRLRRTFSTPEACSKQPCSILFGDLAMVASIALNGQHIGSGGLFPSAHSPNRRYPVHASVTGLLNHDQDNTVELTVWAISPALAGVTADPVAIVSTAAADSFTRAQTSGTIFTPLACALALTLLGALGIIIGLLFDVPRQSSLLFVVYCFSHVAFLASYADTSYEFLPMHVAVPLAFITARSLDMTLAGLLFTTSAFLKWARKAGRAIFIFVTAIAAISSIYVFCFPFVLSDPIDVASATQEVIEVVWRLKFVFPISCIVLACVSPSLRMRLLQIAMYSILQIVLYFDSAALFHNPYGDYSSRFYAVVLASIFAGIFIRSATERDMREKMRNERDALIGKQARQVAHDIKSPLAALTMINEDLAELCEEKRILIRSSTDRITDIANLLVLQNRDSTSNVPTAEVVSEVYQVLHLIELLVSEARIRFRSKVQIRIKTRFTSGAYGLFTNVDQVDFSRAFSNVLNNAVEAIPERGEINVEIYRAHSAICIKISDDGIGVPSDILSQLGTREFTYHKANGSGLGLYQAKEFCERHGGQLQISSKLGHGTCVTLQIPSVAPPNFFVRRLVLKDDYQVVIIDDDAAIHNIWEKRFSEVCLPVPLVHLSYPDQAIQYIRNKSSFFLVDYEYSGSHITGADFITSNDLEHRSLLVTSRCEEIDVRNLCQTRCISAVIKGSAAFLPIEIADPRRAQCVDTILIDDDTAIRVAWERHAAYHSRSIATFSGPHEFFRESAMFLPETPIYVDFRLTGTMRGDKVTRQLTDLGFFNLYIATGDPCISLTTMPWVRGIVGKTPPKDWVTNVS